VKKYLVWTAIMLSLFLAELAYHAFSPAGISFVDPVQRGAYLFTGVWWLIVMLLMTSKPDHPSPIPYFGMPDERWEYPGGHLTSADLERYSQGRMQEGEKLLAWQHVAECDKCHEDLIAAEEFEYQ
jgi:hypothetical protein